MVRNFVITNVILQMTTRFECLGTFAATERFFFYVGFQMDIVGAALNKGLVAHVAAVGPFSGVKTHVNLDGFLLGESSAADVALIRSQAEMAS